MSLSWRTTLGWRAPTLGDAPAVWGAKHEAAATPPHSATLPWLRHLLSGISYPAFHLDSDGGVSETNTAGRSLGLSQELRLPDALAQMAFGDAAVHAQLWRLLALPVDGQANLSWRHRSGKRYLLEAHRLPKLLGGWLVTMQPEKAPFDDFSLALHMMNHDLRAPSAQVITLLDLQESASDAKPSKVLHAELIHQAQQSLHATQWFVQTFKRLQRASIIAPFSLSLVIEEALEDLDDPVSWLTTLGSVSPAQAFAENMAAQRCHIQVHSSDLWVLGELDVCRLALRYVLAAAKQIVGAAFHRATHSPDIQLRIDPPKLGRVELRVMLPQSLTWPAGWHAEHPATPPGFVEQRLWSWGTRRLLTSSGLQLLSPTASSLSILLPQTLSRPE